MRILCMYLAVLLSGCGTASKLFQTTTEVKVPVPVDVAVPPELVTPFVPSVRPYFTSPDDPSAVVGLSEQDARALQIMTLDLYQWGASCRVFLKEYAEH